jgi:formate-dependent nitrite reductase membrane component NrfD
MRLMALEAAVLVGLEVLAILFFLQAAYRQPDSRESAERIMRKRLFVVGYFVVGLAVPLVLMLWAYRSSEALGGANAVVAFGAALGLFGGLVLRQAVLVCGALPTLNMAGFEFRRIARAKEPKPGIGMLPPS